MASISMYLPVASGRLRPVQRITSKCGPPSLSGEPSWSCHWMVGAESSNGWRSTPSMVTAAIPRSRARAKVSTTHGFANGFLMPVILVDIACESGVETVLRQQDGLAAVVAIETVDHGADGRGLVDPPGALRAGERRVQAVVDALQTSSVGGEA